MDRFYGALLGAAYGDSVGAGVEFLLKKKILELYPDVLKPTGCPGAGPLTITDDTQQTLAVCEGLCEMIRSGNHDSSLKPVWEALKRWRLRQDIPGYARFPGRTSLEALSGEIPGTLEHPLNLSPTCGGVMRAHAVGLYAYRQPEKAFDLGIQSAVITHGSPEAYVPSGLLAATIAQTSGGLHLDVSAQYALSIARSRGYDKTSAYLLAEEALHSDPATIEIESFGLGSGWDGDESFSMALHAARRYRNDLVSGCSYAACINGDSDSVATTTGALIGSCVGIEQMPLVCKKLELAKSLMRCARELYAFSKKETRSAA